MIMTWRRSGLGGSIRALACAAGIATSGAASVFALTLDDYEKQMNDAQKASYVTGAVSMLMFRYADEGDTQTAEQRVL